jgi:hypothetical protein
MKAEVVELMTLQTDRHAREGGHPSPVLAKCTTFSNYCSGGTGKSWIPAFAGMTQKN